jgi:hypothetical protein
MILDSVFWQGGLAGPSVDKFLDRNEPMLLE